MIKKAVVAGGIAWVAPTVLATSASAQVGGCTPKCGPTSNGTFQGIVTTISCERQNETGPGSVSPNWHPANFKIGAITNAGSACGCGGAPAVTITTTPIDTFHIASDQWDHGTGFEMHVAYVGQQPARPSAPLIQATIKCKDRAGRSICRTCRLYGVFRWTWMDGPRQSQATCQPPDPPGSNNGPFTVTYTIDQCTTSTCC